jgi:hypothetical protein
MTTIGPGEEITHVHSLILCHLENSFSSFASVNKSLDLRYVFDSRVNNVIPGEPESVITEDSRLS